MNISRGFHALLIMATLGLFGATSNAQVYFFPSGGTYCTLSINGSPVTFQMGPSDLGDPAFDGCFLGTFSLADGNTLTLEGFANSTHDTGSTAISLGKFYRSIYPVGAPSGIFQTNFHSSFYWIGDSHDNNKCHFATNLNVNLLGGLATGDYAVAVYAAAGGNFSPDLEENNNGSNYVAFFRVVQESLAQQSIPFTANQKVRLDFSCETDAGYGKEVYVVGNHPDLGNWNPNDGLKLHWTSGNIWTGSIAVTEGTALQYKYIIRTNDATVYCDDANVIWLPGPNHYAMTPAQPQAPYSGKTMFYYSDWTNAGVVYQCGADTNWYNVAMERFGAGRIAGEYLYRATNFAKSGEKMTFVPHGFKPGVPDEEWDHCPIDGIDDYFTTLDVFLLQDGHIYNYWPPASRTDSSIVTQYIESSYAPEALSRNIQIYVPRNYSQNTWKRYPVLYMHDGQNVFLPGGAYGSWAAEVTANDMISLGMMRETIIVAVDNTDNRLREYLPPGDATIYGAGTGDKYLNFVLHNVRPYVDTHYRTLNDPDNTGVIGSSFGGVASVYFGYATNAFGKIGPMSPSFWACTNFVKNKIIDGNSLGPRIYMDCGTDEGGGGEDSMLADMLDVYNYLQADGHVINDTLLTEVGCGQEHNEAAWASRVYLAFNFLMNSRDEPNQIAQTEWKPEGTCSFSNGVVSVAYTGLKGWTYILQHKTALTNAAWVNVATGTLNNLMWQQTTLSNPVGSETIGFYRIKSQGWPANP